MGKQGQFSLSLRFYVDGDNLFAGVSGATLKLTEVRPGLFFEDGGEALDFTGVVPALSTRLTKL